MFVDAFLSEDTLIREFIVEFPTHTYDYWDAVRKDYIDLRLQVNEETADEQTFINTYRDFIDAIQVTEEEIFWIVMRVLVAQGQEEAAAMMFYAGMHYNWDGYSNETHHGYYQMYTQDDYQTSFNFSQGGVYYPTDTNDPTYSYVPYDSDPSYSNGYTDTDSTIPPTLNSSLGSTERYFSGNDITGRYYGQGQIGDQLYGTSFFLQDSYGNTHQDAKFYPLEPGNSGSYDFYVTYPQSGGVAFVYFSSASNEATGSDEPTDHSVDVSPTNNEFSGYDSTGQYYGEGTIGEGLFTVRDNYGTTTWVE